MREETRYPSTLSSKLLCSFCKSQKLPIQSSLSPRRKTLITMSRKLTRLQPRKPLHLQLIRSIPRSKLLWITVWRSPPASLLALCFSVSFLWRGVLRCSSSLMVGGGSTEHLELANIGTVELAIWTLSSERRSRRTTSPSLLIYWLVFARDYNEPCTMQTRCTIIPLRDENENEWITTSLVVKTAWRSRRR